MISKFDYCAVKNGKAFCGSKEEILNATGEFWFENGNALRWRVNGYPVRILHSYSEQWTEDEIRHDAVKHMFRLLHEYGYTTYLRELDV